MSVYQSTVSRPPVRRVRRPTPPVEGTVYASRPWRRTLAAWWRHRPNPVGTAVVGMWCFYLAGVSRAYWYGPWTWATTAVVLVTGTIALHVSMVAVWWARRWHERQQL